MAFLDIFKKKPSLIAASLPFETDMHSHILPGLDDGSPDLGTSLTLVRGLMSLGIKRSIATPHIISDLYRNTPAGITASLQLLQEGITSAGLDFTVSAAAEYMLDDSFFEKIAQGEPLLTLYDNYILTEFSFGSQPENPQMMSFNIITNGYTPILAHPERYGYFHHNYKAYHLLKELGFVLQVNLLSVTGYYGAPVAKAAKYILKNGLATFAGTDLHHEKHLFALGEKKNMAMFGELFGKGWNIDLKI